MSNQIRSHPPHSAESFSDHLGNSPELTEYLGNSRNLYVSQDFLRSQSLILSYLLSSSRVWSGRVKVKKHYRSVMYFWVQVVHSYPTAIQQQHLTRYSKMATRNKAVQAAVAAASPKPNTKPGKGTVPVAYLTLSGKQPVKAYRANSARALYWASAVVQLKGGTLPLATVYAAWASKPPTTPKSGKAEPPAGWVAYFVRCGLVQITTRHVAAK